MPCISSGNKNIFNCISDIRLRVRAEYCQHENALEGNIFSNKPDPLERAFEKFMQVGHTETLVGLKETKDADHQEHRIDANCNRNKIRVQPILLKFLIALVESP